MFNLILFVLLQIFILLPVHCFRSKAHFKSVDEGATRWYLHSQSVYIETQRFAIVESCEKIFRWNVFRRKWTNSYIFWTHWRNIRNVMRYSSLFCQRMNNLHRFNHWREYIIKRKILSDSIMKQQWQKKRTLITFE